jgi:hypothetical protein
MLMPPLRHAPRRRGIHGKNGTLDRPHTRAMMAVGQGRINILIAVKDLKTF